MKIHCLGLAALLARNHVAADERIVGGSAAPTGRYPYYCSLYRGSVRRSNFVCGASLITPDMVITAAHCDQNQFRVVVGNEDIDGVGEVELRVARKFKHAQYNPFSIKNDIMIMQLTEGTTLVDPVELNFNADVPEDEGVLQNIGLGQLAEDGPLPEELQFVEFNEFIFEQCEAAYDSLGGGFFDEIFDNFFGGMEETKQICAGGDGERSGCFGDSGGPLIVSGGSAGADVQVGVTSYGRGCAQPGFPGVYTRISGYENWIKTRVCEYSNFKPDYCDDFEPDDGSDSGGGGGGGGGIFCFSGKDTVEVENVGNRQMKDLRIGDSIMVSPNKYEPVYSFGHYNKGVETEFLMIETPEAKLEVTRDHLVFVEGGKVVPAFELTKGMKMMRGSDDLATIQSIKTVVRKGFYAPFTPSGKLMVNGFQVSCFVSINGASTINVFGFELNYHHLSHLFESPHRLVCHVLGTCLDESYNDDGISLWNAPMLEAYQWLWSLNSLVFHVVFLLCLAAFGMVAASEFVLSSSCVMLPVMLGLASLSRDIASKKVRKEN